MQDILYENYRKFFSGLGFLCVDTNFPYLTIFYKKEEAFGDFGREYAIKAVCVLDNSNYVVKTGNELIQYKDKIKNYYYKHYGNDPNVLFLINGKDMYFLRNLISGLRDCWLVDIDNKKLYAFENTSECFYSLAGNLERAIDGIYNKPPLLKRIVEFVFAAPVNYLIIFTNVIVFLIMESLGDTTSSTFIGEHGGLIVENYLESSSLYRYITSTFIHFGIMHLFGNMLSLSFVGRTLELTIGSVKYFLIYVISGVTANFFSCLWYVSTGHVNIVSAGASGAIFGVIGALLYILITDNTVKNIKIRNILFMIGITFASGLTSNQTNNSAHLGGLLIGFLLAVILYRKKKAYNR